MREPLNYAVGVQDVRRDWRLMARAAARVRHCHDPPLLTIASRTAEGEKGFLAHEIVLNYGSLGRYITDS